MQENQAQLRKQGLGLAAISYDSQAVLADFSRRHGITFPLLSDPDSTVIRAFGILNGKVPPNSFAYGIPHPGTFIVNRKGVVTAKYFEEDYTQRYTTSDILVRQYGVRASGPHEVLETRHLRLAYSASAATVRSGQRIALTLDIQLKPKMHLYAPGVTGYRPVEWTLAETDAWMAGTPLFPPSRTLYLKAIGERVPIYQGSVRLTREITLAKDKVLKSQVTSSGDLAVESVLHYQACDDKVCYLPEQVPLKLNLRVEGHDTERVAPELRRKAPR